MKPMPSLKRPAKSHAKLVSRRSTFFRLALAAQPRLLFADEPTGSLDQATGGRIIDLLFQMREQTGTALLLVTHDEHLAARCDRRLLLEQGRLEGLA